MSYHTLMVKINLTNGGYAQIDEEDLELVGKYKWYQMHGYAHTTCFVDGKPLPMHRLIMGENELQVDHRNGNRLDNRRENLRLATSQQNKWNMGKHDDNISGYKGVTWHEQIKRWMVRINKDGKTKHLGVFDTLEAAATSYDIAAIEMFGEYARTNFKRDDLPALQEKHKAELSSIKKKGVYTSGYRGVCYDKARDKWSTEINVNKKRKHLGRHNTELEAAQVYDKAAKEMLGEKAKLNFPNENTTE